MSGQDNAETRPEAPTVVATAVPGPGKVHVAGNRPGEVPVAYAQPYAVQDPYGHGQYGHLASGPSRTTIHSDLETGRSIRVTQHAAPDGRNVVTFATMHPDAAMMGNLTDREAELVDVYRLSRFIRNISILNVILTVISGILSYFWFILLPFPLCGYYGAKTFNKTFIYVYIAYLFAEVIGSIVWVVLVNSISFTILRILYILLNLFVIKYATRLCAYITHFNDEDREFLMTNPLIVNSERSCC